MTDQGRPPGSDPVLLADRFALLALALLIAFSLAVLASILPLQLLSVGWQYRFSGALSDNAPVALLGLALIHLAAYLDPDNPHLLNWRRQFGRFALVAVLLFLLLIPLQGWVLWRASTTSSQLVGQQRRTVDREINALLKSIETARSTPELIAALPPAVANSLGPDADRLSLPALRQRLEKDVIQARNALRQQIDSPATAETWTLWKRSLRVIASSLVYAMAFSAFVLVRGSEMSLWREWEAGWRPWNEHPHLDGAEIRDAADAPALDEDQDSSTDPPATECPQLELRKFSGFPLSLQRSKSFKASEQAYFESLANDDRSESPSETEPS
jgi:hypothetical protein